MKKYAKFQKPGFVVEEDGHFVVNYLPVIEGFEAHGVKKTPKLPRSQWVEIIYRNGERDYGPVECFAWSNIRCSSGDRQDYILHKQMGIGSRKPVFDFIDAEITHYRAVDEPPPGWVAHMPFPSQAPERTNVSPSPKRTEQRETTQ